MALVIAAVCVVVAVVFIARWLVLRRRGVSVASNGLSVAALLLAIAGSAWWSVQAPANAVAGYGWVALLIPVAVALIGVVPRRPVRWVVVALLVPFALLTAGTVGPVYVPAAVAAFLAVWSMERPRPRPQVERAQHVAGSRRVGQPKPR